MPPGSGCFIDAIGGLAGFLSIRRVAVCRNRRIVRTLNDSDDSRSRGYSLVGDRGACSMSPGAARDAKRFRNPESDACPANLWRAIS